MKNLIIKTGLFAGALALGVSPALAESFKGESKLGSPTVVGAIGPEKAYESAHWTESYSVTLENGTKVNGTMTCVGMGQPPGDIFDRHVSCSTKDTGGAEASIIAGCQIQDDAGNEMGCTGVIVGNARRVEGRSGLITIHYKFTGDGSGGSSTIVGQWIS
jgi:hypothetical protein